MPRLRPSRTLRRAQRLPFRTLQRLLGVLGHLGNLAFVLGDEFLGAAVVIARRGVAALALQLARAPLRLHFLRRLGGLFLLCLHRILPVFPSLERNATQPRKFLQSSRFSPSLNRLWFST